MHFQALGVYRKNNTRKPVYTDKIQASGIFHDNTTVFRYIYISGYRCLLDVREVFFRMFAPKMMVAYISQIID